MALLLKIYIVSFCCVNRQLTCFQVFYQSKAYEKGIPIFLVPHWWSYVAELCAIFLDSWNNYSVNLLIDDKQCIIVIVLVKFCAMANWPSILFHCMANKEVRPVDLSSTTHSPSNIFLKLLGLIVSNDHIHVEWDFWPSVSEVHSDKKYFVEFTFGYSSVMSDYGTKVWMIWPYRVSFQTILHLPLVLVFKSF